MSAITQSSRDVGLDGIRRYRTKVKVRIDSHDQRNPIWISDDVVSVSVGKTIKGAGQANLMILPRVNYMNLIRPNDYINIYFNIGDGEGWTRTFFGFVDRIEETYSVSQDGAPRTQYDILCTDFYKIFEKTNIYFNPHLAGRPDLSGEFFGTPNIGGLALMTSGVRVHGSPADIVVNLLLLLLGFGTQFSLPPGYNPRFKDVFRARRAQFIQNRLGETARAALEEAGGFQQLQAQIRAEEQGTAQDLANSGVGQSDRVNSLLRERGITNTAERERILQSASAGDVDRVAALLADTRLRNTLVTSDPGRSHDEDRGTLDILRSSLPEATASLLDVIDIFSFVERTAIDGYHDGYTIWQQQGPLITFVNSMSHEIINELIFDLRPVVESEAGQHVSASYSREPDELEGNLPGPDGGRTGITHVPAMIMREYPFSTIDGIDLRGANIQLDGQEGEIGIVYFGEIFADRVNEPGRHSIRIPNINVSDRRAGRGNILAPKSLDVAVVHEEEIVKTTLGRSDHEHVNMFEFYSDALLGQDQRFFMHDLLPIVTPVHVMRHGLRVRSLTTRFARFSLAVADRVGAPAPVEETEAADEAAAPLEPVVTGPGTLTTPVDGNDGARVFNGGFARWGYREKPHLGPNGAWVFHQGIDIGPGALQGTAAGAAIPIYAIADGEVVVSAPDGVFGGYGNVVVIKHDFSGTVRFSVYAHLSSIAVGPGVDTGSGSRRDRARFAAAGMAGGRAASLPLRITKGTVVGTMGNTGFGATGFSRFHLHFEIDRIFPPRDDQVTPRFHFAVPPPGFDGATASGTNKGVYSDTIVPAGEATRPSPPSGYDRSFDPHEFYSSNGINLVASINSGDIVTIGQSNDWSEPDDTDRGPTVDEDSQRPRDEVLQEAGRTPETAPTATSSRNNVDSPLTRQQLIRWALLHDHWYQHNLEYLSGRIEMRGAPEIRVGYRLDIPERSMSFYVESVNHQWQFPNKMTTVLNVTRGQRNDPFPMYVLPPLDPFNPTDTQRRTSSGRLATYFAVPDPIAVRRALVLRSSEFDFDAPSRGGGAGAAYQNDTDSLDTAVTYHEAAVLANSVDPDLSRASVIEIEEDQLRISGELRYELENQQREAAFQEFLDNDLRGALSGVGENLADTFDFTGDATDNPLAESTTETDSGTTGRNLTSGLESDGFEEEF